MHFLIVKLEEGITFIIIMNHTVYVYQFLKYLCESARKKFFTRKYGKYNAFFNQSINIFQLHLEKNESLFEL